MVQSGPLVVRLDHAEINGSAPEEKENREKRGGDVREMGPCSYFVAGFPNEITMRMLMIQSI